MEIPDKRLQTICLLTLTIIAVGVALYLLRSVLVPLVLAAFFSIMLSPALAFFSDKLKLPRGLALAMTLLLGITALVLLGTLIASSVGEMAAKKDDYLDQARDLVDWFADVMPLERLKLDEAAAEETVKGWMEEAAKKVVGETQSLLGNGALVLLFLIFIVLGDPRPAASGVGAEIERSIKSYLATKVVLSAITGIIVGVTLYVLGVDLALVFGVLSFLLNFIPNVGSVIAVLLPLPVILLNPALSVTARICAIVIPAVSQFAIGNIVEPKLMGKSVELDPVVILAALVFWGMLWGLVGALLAVPLTAVLKILLEQIEITRPLANILAGRPSRPAESQ